jgi:hypothetical protein
MPSSIINSDDGVVSGTSGIKTTGGDDGSLKIQTNGVDAISIASDGTVALSAAALPAASGGTGLTSVGASGNVLTSNGTAWTSAAAAAFDSGTVMLFAQTSAPTGWTKSTTHNNKALRVVTGTASSGGSVAFTTAFASQAVSGTVGSTTLAESQMPAHTHTYPWGTQVGSGGRVQSGNQSNLIQFTPATGSTGGGGSHNHTFTGTAINLAVQYVDVIIATKN